MLEVAWYSHDMNTNHTNDELNSLVDAKFERMVEEVLDYDNYTSDEITLICAKLAAKFATYAGDAIDF